MRVVIPYPPKMKQSVGAKQNSGARPAINYNTTKVLTSDIWF
jgi:hypothetical protein